MVLNPVILVLAKPEGICSEESPAVRKTELFEVSDCSFGLPGLARGKKQGVHSYSTQIEPQGPQPGSTAGVHSRGP